MDESFCMHCISYVHPLAGYRSDRLDLVSFIIFRTCDLPAYHFVGSSFLALISKSYDSVLLQTNSGDCASLGTTQFACQHSVYRVVPHTTVTYRNAPW